MQLNSAIYKICFMIGLLSLTGCQSENSLAIFGQNNAIWVESIYFRGYKPSNKAPLTNQYIESLSNTLNTNAIKYAYIFAGPYQEDGHIPAYAFSDTAQQSVRSIKALYPDLVILPWLGGVQDKTVQLGDSAWRANAIADTKRLIDTLNVPGVHVDFEYIIRGEPFLDKDLKPEQPNAINDYGTWVNTFHQDLRTALPNAFISSVVLATSPDTKPWKRKTNMKELETLVQLVDQISFLFYDTGISNEDTFQKNCQHLLADISQLKKHQKDTQFLVAIGTFQNHPALRKFRNMQIENIPNSLKTIKNSAISMDPENQIVDGIALFCDWQTDPKEWKEFYNEWALFHFRKQAN